jgi:hypothetical protein
MKISGLSLEGTTGCIIIVIVVVVIIAVAATSIA